MNAEKILVVGPPDSGRSTLARKLISHLEPYVGLVFGDDVLVDERHWRDPEVAVICTVLYERNVPAHIRSCVTIYYRSTSHGFARDPPPALDTRVPQLATTRVGQNLFWNGALAAQLEVLAEVQALTE